MSAHRIYAVAAATLLWSGPAIGSVTVITNKPAWQNAAGTVTTIPFTEYPHLTTITNQYAPLGVTFTDGNDFIFASGSFSTDGSGLISSDQSGLGEIHLSFSAPTQAVGFEFLGDIVIELYSGGQLVFTSNWYVAGFTPFVGVISTVPFDAAIARDIDDSIMTVDNLYFGTPVPAPWSAALFCAFALFVKSRRHRRAAVIADGRTSAETSP